VRLGVGIAGGTVAAGLLALAWLVFGGDAPPDVPTQAVARMAEPGLTPSAGMAGDASVREAAFGAMSVAEVDAAIAASSLRGSSADGDWGIGTDGRFRPTRELRRRFDYYLALQGEVPLDALQRWMEAQLRTRHGAAAVAQVMPVFAAYLRLQQHPWQIAIDPTHPERLGAAVAERVQVRREMLGIAVAEAFYSDEDAALQALIAQANTSGGPTQAAAPAPTPESQAAVETLPDAPARLAQWQTRWDDWERRIAAARAEVARLRAAPELSAPQRLAAIDAWVAERFDAAEQQRARALLDLPLPH
jgi:lipase chaperone LimK